MFSLGLFCSSEQLLTFLIIFGVVSAVLLAIREKISVKTMKGMFILLFIAYFLIFILAFLYGLIALSILIIISYISIKKKNLIMSVMFFAILITYLFAGITGNACLYLPANDVSWYGTEIYEHGVTIATGGYPEHIPCLVKGISINKNSERSMSIGFYYIEDDWWNSPSKTIIVAKEDRFTYCCMKWKLLDFDNNTSTWGQPSDIDVFCWVQNLFDVNGIYRTNSENIQKNEREDSGTNEEQINGNMYFGSVAPEKEIYSVGEKTKTVFIIKNNLKKAYNITAYYIYNNSKNFIWFNESTENYDISVKDNEYNIYFYPQYNGNYEVQIVINYTDNRNDVVIFDEIIEIRVL